MIGIGVTTYNRPEMLANTMAKLRQYSPPDTQIVVVNDGGDKIAVAESHARTVINLDSNHGIAYAKNRCLSELWPQCDHIFLFDDDTYPTGPDWWKPYVEHPEPHLQYQFESSPGHWAIKEIDRNDVTRWFDKSRGCMLYVEKCALDEVGGMSLAFGKHGAEHEDWSLRIHEAGLTTLPFGDVLEPRLHCADQDNAGISSVDYRDNQAWKLIDRTRLDRFQDFISNGSERVVLIPRRADYGWRDELWHFCESNFWRGQWVFQGHHESSEGPFNRGAAINRAAAKAGNWEVAIIIDGDVWVPQQNLDAAISKAIETGRMVAAFDAVYELDQATTEYIIGWEDENRLPSLDHTKTVRVRTGPLETQSLMLVVPRPVFEAVQGFDERFRGWGGDDNAFWQAARVLTGEPLRISGPAYHLWHPSGAPENKAQDPNYVANYNLWQRYSRAVTQEAMRSLIAERDG